MSFRAPSLRALALFAAGLIAAGCGDDSTTAAPAGSDEFVKNASIAVWAPTPLDKPFNDLALDQNLTTQMSLSGANALAVHLADPEAPDLFVADSEPLMDQAVADGLVEQPVPIATDELVVAVPKDSKIDSVDDLAAGGVKVAIGQQGVPVGDYAREALAGLPAAESKAILANATVEEANNNGIIEDLTKGDADAGFVYATDVKGNSGKLKAVELPAGARPEVVYVGAVVPGGENPPGGQHFLDAMLEGKGAELLKKYGFGPPPG